MTKCSSRNSFRASSILLAALLAFTFQQSANAQTILTCPVKNLLPDSDPHAGQVRGRLACVGSGKSNALRCTYLCEYEKAACSNNPNHACPTGVVVMDSIMQMELTDAECTRVKTEAKGICFQTCNMSINCESSNKPTHSQQAVEADVDEPIAAPY